MALPLPVDTAKELAEVNVPLSAAVRTWLLKHGKVVEPRLTTAQRTEYKECFRLMDADGSGAIDMTELQAAFKLLGIGLSKQEITEIVHEVDTDGTGDVDWGEFLHIMTITMKRLSDGKGKQEGDAGYQMPFNLMATQYRRKRYMEGVMTGHSATIGNVLNELTKESSLAQLHRTSLSGNAYIGARSKRWLAATSSTAGCDWRLFVSQDGADAPSGPRKHRHALNQLHHGMTLQKQQEEEEEQQRAMQQRREQQMRRQEAQLFAYYNQYQHHDHHLDSTIQQQQQDLAQQAEEDGTRPWHPLAWPPTTPPHRNTATPSGGGSGSGGGSTSGLAARLRAQTEVRPPSSGPVPMGDLLSGARDSKPKPSRQQQSQQQQQVQHDGGFSIMRKPTSSGGLGSATGASVNRGASRQAASGTSRTHQEPVGSWGWAPQSPSRHPPRTSTATTTNSPKYTAKGARALARAGLVGGSLPSSPRPSAGPIDWSSDAFRPGTVPLMPWTGGKLDGCSRPTTAASALSLTKASPQPFPGAAPLDHPASPTAALPASPGVQPQEEGAVPGRPAAGPSLLSYPAHNIAVAAAAAQRTALAVKAAFEASQELQNREGQGSAPNSNHVRERAKAYERLLQSRGASRGSVPSPGASTRPAPLHPLNRDVKPSTPSSAQVFASLPLQTTLAPLTSMTQQLPSGAGVEWQPVLSVAPLATQGSSAALQPPPDQQPSWPEQGQQAQEGAAQQQLDSQSAPAAQGSAPQQQQQAAASEHMRPGGSVVPGPQDQQSADGSDVPASQQVPHSSSGGSCTDTSPPSSIGGCAEGAGEQSAPFVDLGASVHSTTPSTVFAGHLPPGGLPAGSDEASAAGSEPTAEAGKEIASRTSDGHTAVLGASIPAPSFAVKTGPDAPGAGAGSGQEPATSAYTGDPAFHLSTSARLSKQPERPEGSCSAEGPGGLSLGGTAIAGTVQTGHLTRSTQGPGPDADPAKPRHSCGPAGSRVATGQAGQGRSASMVAAVPVTGRASTFKTVAANEPLGLAAHKKAWASLAVKPVPRMSFMVELQAPSEEQGQVEHGGEGASDAAASTQAGGAVEQAQGAGSGGDVLGSVASAGSLMSKISGGSPGVPAGTVGRWSGAAAGGDAARGSLPPGLKASVFPRSAAQSLLHSSMQRR